jgi:hypothetical protein
VTAVKIHRVYENPFNFLNPLTAIARAINPEISKSPVTFVNSRIQEIPEHRKKIAAIISNM